MTSSRTGAKKIQSKTGICGYDKMNEAPEALTGNFKGHKDELLGLLLAKYGTMTPFTEREFIHFKKAHEPIMIHSLGS